MTNSNSEAVADSSSQTETDEVPELDTANSNVSDIPNNSESSNSEDSASGGRTRINAQITSEVISFDETSNLNLVNCEINISCFHKTHEKESSYQYSIILLHFTTLLHFFYDNKVF